MAWKVKNEIPIGSSTRGTTSGRAPMTRNNALMLSAKKLAYLKTPSTVRLAPIANASHGCDRRAATRIAMK